MNNHKFFWLTIAAVVGGALITGSWIGSVVGELIMLTYIIKDK